jgi:hypothetical protein
MRTIAETQIGHEYKMDILNHLQLQVFELFFLVTTSATIVETLQRAGG